jgi:hypothetical protein
MKKIIVLLLGLSLSTSLITTAKETGTIFIKEEMIKNNVDNDLDVNVSEQSNKKITIPEKDLDKFTHYQSGMASYYSSNLQGSATASGERFNNNALTAAHRKLPFGTKIRVTNVNNGKSVIVRVNDRGPYTKGRVIDLSKAAFSKIASISSGVTRVKLEVMK